MSSRTHSRRDASEGDEQDATTGGARRDDDPGALEDHGDVAQADDGDVQHGLVRAARSGEAGAVDDETLSTARRLDDRQHGGDRDASGDGEGGSGGDGPDDRRAPQDVLEAPTLGARPSSPWVDGLGRTAIRCAQALLVGLVVGLVVYAAVQLRVVVIPLLLAALVASAAAPLVTFLARHRFSRALATAAVLLAGLLVLAGVGYFLVVTVAGQWGALSSSASQGFDQLQTFVTDGPVPISDAQLTQAREAAVNVLTGQQFRSTAISGLSTVATVVTGIVLGLVVLFYFLKDGPRIWAFLISATDGPAHARLAHVGLNATGVLGGYVRGTAAVAVVDAIFIGGGVALLGVPLAVPIAVVVFIGAFIPLVGATVAGVLAALVALVTNGPTTALIVIIIVVAVNQIEGNLLQPLLLGKALSLHPLAILVALTAGTILAGIIGTLISVPLAAVLWSAVTTWNADKRAARARVAAATPS